MTHTPTSRLPAFDVRDIPFSVRGSWLNLSPVVALHTRTDAIHLVSHRNNSNMSNPPSYRVQMVQP